MAVPKNIAVGLHKGHKVTKIAKKQKPSKKRGVRKISLIIFVLGVLIYRLRLNAFRPFIISFVKLLFVSESS